MSGDDDFVTYISLIFLLYLFLYLRITLMGYTMPVNYRDKIKGPFIPQMPLDWIAKLPSNSAGYVNRVAMYIWHLKGVKKTSNDLLVSLKGINSFLPIPDWAFPRALDILEKCGMIKSVRHPGKTPIITVLCDEFYEEYPTLKF